MKNRVPSLPQNTKICIICEGNEEYQYFDKLKGLNVWHNEYEVSLENAGGNGNIPAIYQDKYQNGAYDLVLMFCDTDRKPYEQYADIKHKINEFHDVSGAADEVLIYGNPCTMQIIIQHWKAVSLTSPAKRVNAPVIEDCTGVSNYKGRSDQLKRIFEQITKENYIDMLKRVKNMPDDDTVTNSSNFGRFMDYLADKDTSWVKKINRVLEE